MVGELSGGYEYEWPSHRFRNVELVVMLLANTPEDQDSIDVGYDQRYLVLAFSTLCEEFPDFFPGVIEESEDKHIPGKEAISGAHTALRASDFIHYDFAGSHIMKLNRYGLSRYASGLEPILGPAGLPEASSWGEVGTRFIELIDKHRYRLRS